MFWKTLDFTVNLVEIVLIFVFLKNFYPYRIKNKYLVAGLLILQTCILTGTNMLLDHGSFLGMFIIVISISFISYMIFYDKFSVILIPTLLWIIVIGIVEFTITNILAFSFRVPTDTFMQDNGYKVMLFMLSRAILLLLIRDCQKYIIVSSTLKKIYLYEITIVLLFDMAILLAIPRLLAQTLSIGISTILISIIIIGFSILLIKVINIIMEFSIKGAEYEVQTQYIRSMNNFIQQLRAQRHDFNHHIGCLHGLMDTNKNDEAKKYIEQLLINAEEMNALVNTENAYVTAILNHKLNIAKAEDINLEVNVDIPLKLMIEPVDLSIILGNALDNAIEACKKVEGYKYISIDIHEKLGYLVITIKNSKKNHVMLTEGTSKEDYMNHGFGLKNIKYVVNKYNGKMENFEQDEEFVFHALISNLERKVSKSII